MCSSWPVVERNFFHVLWFRSPPPSICMEPLVGRAISSAVGRPKRLKQSVKETLPTTRRARCSAYCSLRQRDSSWEKSDVSFIVLCFRLPFFIVEVIFQRLRG